MTFRSLTISPTHQRLKFNWGVITRSTLLCLIVDSNNAPTSISLLTLSIYILLKEEITMTRHISI